MASVMVSVDARSFVFLTPGGEAVVEDMGARSVGPLGIAATSAEIPWEIACSGH